MTSLLKPKHTIFILFIFSCFRPLDIELKGVYEACFLMLLISVVMCFILTERENTFGFLRENKTSVLVVHALFLVFFLSFADNFWRFGDIYQGLTYGLSYIVISYLFFICFFIFTLQSKKNDKIESELQESHVLAFLLLFISVFAWFQFFFPVVSSGVSKYFLAKHLASSNNISSIFAINTDLGSVLGIGLVTLAVRVKYHLESWPPNKLLILIVAMVGVASAGVMSGARVFYLILFVSMIVAALNGSKRRKLENGCFYLISFLCIFLLICHLMPLETVRSLSNFVPAIFPYYLGEFLSISDFYPDLTLNAFGERADLWLKATALLSEGNNWLLGVSNGGFRLALNNPINNSHSIWIQMVIDGGIIAGMLYLGLLFTIFKVIYKKKHFKMLIIFCAVITSLSVDYQIDHSLPWIVLVSFMLAIGSGADRPNLINSNSDGFATRFNNRQFKFYKVQDHFKSVSIALAILSVAVYGIKYYNTLGKNTLDRLDSIVNARQIVLPISSLELALGREIDERVGAAYFPAINQIDAYQKHCSYNHLDARILTLHSLPNRSRPILTIPFKTADLFVYDTKQLNCDENSYIDASELNKEFWVSNSRHYYFYTNALSANPIWENLILTSPLIKLESTEEYSVNTEIDLLRDLPATQTIKLSVYSWPDNKLITERKLKHFEVHKGITQGVNFETKSQVVYLEIKVQKNHQFTSEKQNFIILDTNKVSIRRVN